ncbi:MAG TPA: hypothetical protein VMV01_03020, partial [Planctomycetota bacterium]|nr:hypothetical protein [Planctomycetota bacterium]
MGRPAPLELALYALCWAAPLSIGAVHPTTQILLAGGALGLCAWSALGPQRERGLRIPPLAWPILIALAWTALSLLPLPLGALRLVSPAAAELRSELGARWAPLTLDAPATAQALVRQLAFLGVVLVGADLFRKRPAARAATALAALGAVVTISIALHRSLSPESIYLLYVPRSHPGSGFFAPFVNGNHAASLLALCALSAAGAAVAGGVVVRVVGLVVATGATMAILATTSRGGVVGLALGAALLIVHLATQHYGRRRGAVLAL